MEYRCQGTFGNVWGAFGVITTGGHYRYLMDREAVSAAKYSAMHGTLPYNKELGHNMNSVGTENPCSNQTVPSERRIRHLTYS